MDLYSILNPSNKPTKFKSSTFHLVKLPNNLITEIKSRKQNSNIENLFLKYAISDHFKYQFKSKKISDSPYFITPNSTFKLRQQNHSNCLMLLKNDTNYLNFQNYLIFDKDNHHIKNTKSFTNLEFVKSFDDINQTFINQLDISNECSTIHDLHQINKSLISNFNENFTLSVYEFENLIIDLAIVPNYDKLLKFDNSIILVILNLILISILELEFKIHDELIFNNLIEIINLSNLKILKKLKIPKNHLTVRLVTTVLLKFSNMGEERDQEKPSNDTFLNTTIKSNVYKLNHNKVIKFLTLNILKSEGTILLDDLLIQIRLHLPINYLPNFEINEILNGISYSIKGDNNSSIIKHLTIDQLTTYNTPKSRFDYLFKLKSQWSIDEMAPFIEPVNTKGLKIEKFCLKYCRVHKGKKTTLTKRN